MAEKTTINVGEYPVVILDNDAAYDIADANDSNSPYHVAQTLQKIGSLIEAAALKGQTEIRYTFKNKDEQDAVKTQLTTLKYTITSDNSLAFTHKISWKNRTTPAT